MVKNQIQIEFGHGDVGIMLGKRNDGKEVAMFLTNESAGKVGRRVPTIGWNPAKAAAVISFSNVESIDVVIEHLKTAKKMLKEKNK